MTTEPLSLRDTATGAAVRGGILLAGALLVSGWIAALTLRVASKAIHLLLILGLTLLGIGLATYEGRKVERRLRAV